jgi:hypothetical protein
MLWYQCHLLRDDVHEIAWIEARGAKKGAWVEIKGDEGRLWEVLEVYGPGREKAMIDRDKGKARKAFHSGDIVRGNK